MERDGEGGAGRGGEDLRQRGVRAEVDRRARRQVPRGADGGACRGEHRLFVAWLAAGEEGRKGGIGRMRKKRDDAQGKVKERSGKEMKIGAACGVSPLGYLGYYTRCTSLARRGGKARRASRGARRSLLLRQQVCL